MIKILAVALGGAIGSTGRYLTSLAVESFSNSRYYCSHPVAFCAIGGVETIFLGKSTTLYG